MKRKRACRVYAVELNGDGRDVYVGSTARTPAERFATHKRGGRTASGVVRRRGKRLRPDLVRGATSETALRKRLERAGWRVYGSAKRFRPRRT